MINNTKQKCDSNKSSWGMLQLSVGGGASCDCKWWSKSESSFYLLIGAWRRRRRSSTERKSSESFQFQLRSSELRSAQRWRAHTFILPPPPPAAGEPLQPPAASRSFKAGSIALLPRRGERIACCGASCRPSRGASRRAGGRWSSFLNE